MQTSWKKAEMAHLFRNNGKDNIQQFAQENNGTLQGGWCTIQRGYPSIFIKDHRGNG